MHLGRLHCRVSSWRADEPDTVGCCRHTFHRGGCAPAAVFGEKGSDAWPPRLDRSDRYHCRLWGTYGAARERGLVVRARRSRRRAVSRRDATDGRDSGLNGLEGTVQHSEEDWFRPYRARRRGYRLGKRRHHWNDAKYRPRLVSPRGPRMGWLHRRNAARPPWWAPCGRHRGGRIVSALPARLYLVRRDQRLQGASV